MIFEPQVIKLVQIFISEKHKMSEKRKRESEKPACKYGEKCYRKNAVHLETDSHPGEV